MKGEVSGGSSNVRDMACAREDECFGDNAHKEHCKASLKNLSHTHEKFARVNACEVSVLFTPNEFRTESLHENIRSCPPCGVCVCCLVHGARDVYVVLTKRVSLYCMVSVFVCACVCAYIVVVCKKLFMSTYVSKKVSLLVCQHHFNKPRCSRFCVEDMSSCCQRLEAEL